MDEHQAKELFDEMDTAHPLNTPLTIGKCQLKHRVVLPPLTRFRADDKHVPHDYVAEYYAQRASVPGTFLITEGTFISPRAGGYDHVPGIWSEDQIKGWKKVTDAVHAKGSFVFMQLWNLGRVADEATLAKDGCDVVGPSAIPLATQGLLGTPIAMPRELTTAEVESYFAEYAQAAKNAIAAGFDGVEIHGANGYLIDQFTQDMSNQRTDKYGGSVENRARFGLEVARACIDAIGAERVGYRVSPYGTFQEMGMKDPVPQFEYLVGKLAEMGVAYVHGVESMVDGPVDADPEREYRSLDFLVNTVQKVNPDVAFISAGGHNQSTATQFVANRPGLKVAVGLGRSFIANPDLPFRIFNNIPWRQWDRTVFYTPEKKEGYIDYTFCPEFEAAMQGKAAAQAQL
ncbi:hypothetical protein KEM52_004960 [Ascosphaera acerosa]|nr:hypothetical protein KEM52_004960 [Ascosphaera acerosa]